MKVGMNLRLWTDDPTPESFFPVLAQVKKIGFDVELPVFDLDLTRWEARQEARRARPRPHRGDGA